jgi:transcriptional regulator with XRE-family HTH domain
MATLKEIRAQRGLRQADVAAQLQRSVSEISCYESGSLTPDLEDIAILEQEFGQSIEWPVPYSEDQKHEIVTALQTLLARYPLQAVFNFAGRALREGVKSGNPTAFFRHYARACEDRSIKPLLPPGIKD